MTRPAVGVICDHLGQRLERTEVLCVIRTAQSFERVRLYDAAGSRTSTPVLAVEFEVDGDRYRVEAGDVITSTVIA